MYTISFIPVIPTRGYDLTRNAKSILKVLEVKIELIIRFESRLYQTDRGEVFVRRDGSVQGPLKASQIADWYTNHRTLQGRNAQSAKKQEARKADVSVQRELLTELLLRTFIEVSCKTNEPRHSTNAMPFHDKQTDTPSRLNEIEASIRERQMCMEREIVLIRGYYEAREKALQAELENSKYELLSKKRKNKKRKSAKCTIL